MAGIKKSDLIDHVAARLAPHLPSHSRILVGLSGGIDSVVLLHLLHSLAPRFSWRLAAMHVHHGISPHADEWARFCAELCARYGIPLEIARVDITPLREAHGIEAAARRLRYRALLARECDYVALAHHADDQAETLLLQLLRGAGVRGAAAMPFLNQTAAAAARPAIVRPLLDVSRAELKSWAEQHGLEWVEDDSNADDRYPRNFLRHHVLPLLNQRFPVWRRTLSRSAAHFAEAAILLDELAAIDAQGMKEGEGLCVEALRALSAPRARNLLRYYLSQEGAPMPQQVQLETMLEQALHARADAQMRVCFGGWEMRRYRGRLYVMPALESYDRALSLVWRGEKELFWPPLGKNLKFCRTLGKGVHLARFRPGTVELRLRNGGERFRAVPGAPSRSIKNLMQQLGVPPWQRERLPLLYCDGELCCIPGVGVTAGFQTAGDEPGIVVQWSAGCDRVGKP